MAADVPVQSNRVAPRIAGPGMRPRRAVATARRLFQSHRRAVRGLYSVVLALVAWEVVGRYVVTSKLMFAPFSRVIVEFGRLWMSGELEHHMLVSFSALAMGFAIAAAVGIAIGSLIAVSPAVGEHIDPLINALYATPLIALSPILIMAFGIGPASKVAIVFLLCVFPILINTTSGIRSADDGLVEAARSFSASRGEIFRLVLLPSALPFIVAGLRIAMGRGLVGIFIGELFGARAGLGYLISISGQTFDIPAMFVGVLVLAVAGVVSVAALEYLERRIAPWRHFDLKA